jgi:hypothetical protein
MKTFLILFLSSLASFCSFGQNLIINPGFESTTLGSGCYTNQPAASVTAGLDNVTAFYGGTSDGIDIGVSAACYSGGSNSGAVHVVLAGLSGSNMFESISFDLNSSIVIGQTYNLSFYAANSSNVNPESLKVGVSNSATSFGTLLSTVSLGPSSLYVQYLTSFTATAGGMYLTIEPGALGNFWFGLDDFELSLVSPPCTTPPTAVCQNINVYLDATGNATIAASDLDGGSLDNCATGLTFSASQTAFTCADVPLGGTPSDALIITGVMDGPLPGGLPKTIEMYAASAISDLSLYGISSANNGTGSTLTPEYTFPADALISGQFIYVTTDSVNFNAWFGFDPNYTDGMASINGDDAIELFYNGNVVDVFGEVTVDGTGQPWEHLDGWAYRNSSTGPDGSVFALGSWSFSGINALDGETSNATASIPFPIASYVSGGSVGTAVTLTVTDGNTFTDDCIATVTVLDTISPTASQPAPILVECTGDIPAADPLIFTDEADNCAAPNVLFVGDVSDGLSCPETITRSYAIIDASGNTTTINQIITVSDITDPIMVAAPANVTVECIGDVPVMIDLGYTDNCDAPGMVTGTDVSDGLTCPETITRTWTFIDACGNSSTVDQIITVEDLVAPTLGAAPSDFNSSCDVTLAALGAPTATDNCSGSITGTPNVTFPITAAGTTTVTWTYTDVCGNQSTQAQDVIIAPQDVTTTLFGLTITTSNATAAYQWIDCATNDPISGETGISYNVTANGSYAVIITENGCSDTSACTVIDFVGIDGLDFETLSLYPNPTANGMFSINTVGTIKEIELIDMMGRIVQVEINLTDKSVDASKLEPGKYIVQIKSHEDRILKGTIVIQ